MIAQGVLYQHKARPSWGPGLVVGLGEGKAEVAFADGEVRTIRAPERYLEVVEGGAPEPVRAVKPKRANRAKPRRPAERSDSWADDDARLRELFASDRRDAEIATELGRSIKAIRDRRGKLGLLRRELISATEKATMAELRRRGHSIASIAKITGRSRHGIAGVLRRAGVVVAHGSEWGEAVEDLRGLFDEGLDDKAIGKILGRTPCAVQQKRLELGMMRRASPKRGRL